MEYLVWQIRLLLVLCSVGAFVFVMKFIRKSRVKIEHTLFWLLVCLLMLLMSVFPQIPFWLAGLLGIESPSNFVFLFLIALLLVSQFFMAMRLSQQEIKLQELVQAVALKDRKKEKGKEDTDECKDECQ